jgi:hypothetical protein
MDAGRGTNEAEMRRPLEFVALWQFACFIMLIAFVWAAEVVDLKHLMYNTPREPVDWLKASILTAGIITIGIITVGHTYIQEKRILRGFIIVCSYCHKVQIENRAWQQMEVYVSDRSLAEFTHGVCPTCYERVMGGLNQAGGTKS